MTQAQSEPTESTTKKESSTKGKGKVFFERAEQVAMTGNWDFAIEMYLEGIQREPDAVAEGHQKLREVAMKRKAKGGRGPGMMDQLKRRQGKDPLQNLVNAEYMLGKDPGSVTHMEQVFKAAKALELGEVVNWISDILLEAQRKASKCSRRILLMITLAYEELEEYAKASQACDLMLQANANDVEFLELRRNISAKYTIQKGRYDQEGDFTRSVADMDKQKELMQKDALVKDEKYLLEEVERTRREYLENPTVPGKINALADALLRLEDESYENEAVDVLTKAHKDTGVYAFKMRVGDIRMRQMTRRYRKLVEGGDTAGATQQAQRQLAFELEEYTERAANYPTDLSVKFELGRRQFLVGQLDEAIASLQQAQRDPRRTVRARSLVGQAFTKKGWYHEAAETFERALEAEMTEERSKELRYYLGDVLQQMGEYEKAQEQFSIVAQIDYNYKDVRARIEQIRDQIEEARKSGDSGRAG